MKGFKFSCLELGNNSPGAPDLPPEEPSLSSLHCKRERNEKGKYVRARKIAYVLGVLRLGHNKAVHIKRFRGRPSGASRAFICIQSCQVHLPGPKDLI